MPAKKPKLGKREMERERRKKIQLREIDAALERLREQAGALVGFAPHPKQVPVFDAVHGGKKVVVFQGGNRSGKSVWLITELLSLLFGIEAWSGRPMPFKAPVQARLFGEDWTHHVGMVLVPMLKEFCPKGDILRTKRNNQGVEYLWEFRNGSTLEVMTYQQPTDSVEGWSGHVVAMDEPPPRDKYIACRRGLVDHGGVLLMSMTPLKEAWIYDEIITNPRENAAVFMVDIRDNPHLSEGAIADFEASLSVEEKEARLHGKWLHLQGLVYKEWDPGVHIVEPFEGGVPVNYTCYVAIDPHPRTEHAVVFMAVDRFGRCYVVDEIFRHGSPEEIGDWVVRWHRREHEIDTVVIDPAAKGDAHRGDTTYEIIDRMMGNAGIGFQAGSKDLETGIRVTKDALMGRNKTPSLFVLNHCQRTIYEFSHYIWGDWRRSAAQDRTVKQKPVDKDDHMLECIRRLLLLPAEHRQTGYIRNIVEQSKGDWKPLDAVAGY